MCDETLKPWEEGGFLQEREIPRRPRSRSLLATGIVGDRCGAGGRKVGINLLAVSDPKEIIVSAHRAESSREAYA